MTQTQKDILDGNVFGHSDAFYAKAGEWWVQKIQEARQKALRKAFQKKARDAAKRRLEAKRLRKAWRKHQMACQAIKWGTFTLTGAFRLRSFVLAMLTIFGLKYHPKRLTRTHFIIHGGAHSGDKRLESYYNFKAGPG